MWISFLQDIDVRVTRCMVRAYRRGTVCFVHDKHARLIIDGGYGVAVEGPSL